MSLHNFNSNTKSWKMYTNTLTSISGDDLLVMPSYGKDLILEVSANNDIFFKKGTITKRFDNLVSDYLDMSFVREASFNSLNSRVQYILQEISGVSVKDFITSGISNDLLIKSYDGRDIILEVSGNNEIIFKRGDISYNLDDLIGGGGGGGSSQNSDYAKYNILDITGKIIFTDNSNIEINNDASFNNVDVGGSLNVAGTISASNIYTKSQVDASLVNVYTKSQVDASLANIYTKSQLDASFSNVYTKSQLDASFSNVYTKLSVIDSSLVNVYTRGQVDVSFVSKQLFDASLSSIQLTNVYTKNQVDVSFISKQYFEASYNVLAASNGGGSGGYIQNNENISFDILNITDTIIFTDNSNIEINNDASFNNVDVSGSLKVAGSISASNIYTKSQVDVSFVSKQLFDASLSSIQLTNVYTKSQVDASLANIYTKSQVDASFLNIYTKSQVDVSFVSKQLFDASLSSIQLTNVYTKNQVDVSFISKQYFEASYNVLVSSIGTSGGASDSSINMVISISDNKITTATRVYQEISNNSNWNAVNGYYGLAKQSFPALNPLTSGAKALAYWSFRSTSNRPSGFTFNLRTIVWAPKLRMFLTFSDAAWNGSGAMYSYDGINWINIFSSYALLWDVKGLCWSEELGIFVAVSHRHPKLIYSYNGIDWYSNTTFTANGVTTGSSFSSVCWSPELGIFVAVSSDLNLEYKAFISNNGINWIAAPGSINILIKWGCVCWSPQLGLFVATPTDYRGGSVGDPPVSVTGFVVMTSYDGYTWTVRSFPSIVSAYPNWDSIAWSPQLGLFVAVSWQGDINDASIVTSNDGINWVVRRITNPHQQIRSVCWSAELGLFVAASAGIYMYSSNGTIWQDFENIQENGEYISFNAQGVCWSPELGIFVAVGGNNIWSSVLKGRIPTISNVFDSSFNRIDETGKWSFQNLGVTGTFTNTSDDRLKHNEIVISNGLTIIDSLTPKFYQKTLTMLDASYNGDLSTQAWTYEAGVIAQELLQISDLSFVVSGGNYYQERYIYSRPTNDPSNTNYDPSFNIYDISNANYTISNNLITQAYNVNYNSVFVYGLAAIKELHTKVKAQATSISSLQTSMLEQQATSISSLQTALLEQQATSISSLQTVLLEQQATINSLLTRIQALEPNASQ